MVVSTSIIYPRDHGAGGQLWPPPPPSITREYRVSLASGRIKIQNFHDVSTKCRSFSHHCIVEKSLSCSSVK